MENGGKGVKLVEARNDTTILNVGQPADMEDKVRATAVHGNLVTSFLNIAISESKGFASLS
jgi:hypothetical protein